MVQHIVAFRTGSAKERRRRVLQDDGGRWLLSQSSTPGHAESTPARAPMFVCTVSSEGRKEASPHFKSVWPSEGWFFLTFDVCTGEE